MNTPVSPEGYSDRRDYMSSTGFTLVTDVNRKLLADVERTDIQQVTLGNQVIDRHYPNVYSADLSLCLTTRSLMLPFVRASDIKVKNTHNSDGNPFHERYNISENDLAYASQHFLFDSGFGDLDFPWHFSAAVASAAIDIFNKEGYVSDEQRIALTLGDWANVIGSGWFSNLVHSMAYTRNGVYASFGRSTDNYIGASNRLARRIQVSSPLLSVDKQFEPEENRTYLTAKLTPEAKRSLREELKSVNSTGCPAARHSAFLLKHVADTNPHVQSMINSGALKVPDVQPKPGLTKVYQEFTAIDESLALFALLLDRYDQTFGTPFLVKTRDKVSLEHRHIPATNVLFEEAESSSVA